MIPFAKFSSKHTSQGLRIFRYHTELHSKNGAGNPIGLVYMLNPGSARPVDDEIFNELRSKEFSTGYVQTLSDSTMKKVISFIKYVYQENGLTLPDKYTIHIENLFNLREKNSNEANRLARSLINIDDLMYISRDLNVPYQFVWYAWGKANIKNDRQEKLLELFPNAIQVNKLNVKGEVRKTSYPVHPLFMNRKFFLEAARGKIFIN